MIEEKRFFGIANPSGALALNNNQFIVADDEINQLLIYDFAKTDEPVQFIDLTKLFPGAIVDGEDMEIDLESATEIEGTYFLLGSHSTSKKGKSRPARRKLFAIQLKTGGHGDYVAQPAGEIYATLIDDLVQDKRFDKYHFDDAQTIAPKAVGGLSIEGLAATPEKTLLIGFRNPMKGGEVKKGRLKNAQALLIELLNPFEVMHGVKAVFAAPMELNLDGFGIRDIIWWKKHKFLIVAGPYHDNIPTEDRPREEFKLFQWSKKSGEVKLLDAKSLEGLNVEAIFFLPERHDQMILLSDDGKAEGEKAFRSRTILVD